MSTDPSADPTPPQTSLGSSFSSPGARQTPWEVTEGA
jgi:hypothetical protein